MDKQISSVVVATGVGWRHQCTVVALEAEDH